MSAPVERVSAVARTMTNELEPGLGVLIFTHWRRAALSVIHLFKVSVTVKRVNHHPTIHPLTKKHY